jgi:hypothetical protein
MMSNHKYNLVAENPQSTVVVEYTPAYRTARSYQSEAELFEVLTKDEQKNFDLDSALKRINKAMEGVK